MLVVLYAVIREKEKVYHVWDWDVYVFFMCFAFGSYFCAWSSYKNLRNLKNLKKTKNVKRKTYKTF